MINLNLDTTFVYVNMHFMSNSKNFITIAITSRALFDLRKSNAIFEQHGLDAYKDHQITQEEKVLRPGPVFPLIEKLLNINDHIQNDELKIEVVLLSRNSASTGLRIFNSIEHYQLPITKAVFTDGGQPWHYLEAFSVDLFLSANPEDVQFAMQRGITSATIVNHDFKANPESEHQELRIAFDGDAVLFSDEAQRVYDREGITKFLETERVKAHTPLAPGPFKQFLHKVVMLQQALQQDNTYRIRTALITARSAPAHHRVITTMRSWKLAVDESVFLGGTSKKDFIHAFKADIFFDDQPDNCSDASDVVTSGHVPSTQETE